MVQKLAEVNLWERKTEAATKGSQGNKKSPGCEQRTSTRLERGWCNWMTWDSRERKREGPEQVAGPEQGLVQLSRVQHGMKGISGL